MYSYHLKKIYLEKRKIYLWLPWKKKLYSCIPPNSHWWVKEISDTITRN